MATIKGILGQEAPAAATDTDLYIVPVGKNASVKIISTNRSTTTTVRIWIAVNGVATSNEQYVSYDQPLSGNDSIATTTVIIGDNDVVRVRAASADVSFTCTGFEQDN